MGGDAQLASLAFASFSISVSSSDFLYNVDALTMILMLQN